MYKTLEKKGLSFSKVNYNQSFLIFLYISGFFMGRINIFNSINPVAIAYVSCLNFRGASFYFTILFTIIGFLTQINKIYFSKYIICSCLLIILNLTFRKNFIKNIVLKSLFGSICILISGISIAIINNFSFYYIMLAILETSLTFSLTIIFNKSIEAIFSKNKKIFTTEEIVSLIILISSIISGCSDIYLGDIYFTYFFIIIFMLIICYNLGSAFGCVCGIACSLLLNLNGEFSTEIMLIFCSSAIFSGLLKESGKILTAVSFLISMYVLSFLLKFSLIDKNLFYSSFFASVVFIILPFKIIKYNDESIDLNKSSDYVEKLKSLTLNKLNNYSNSFKKLSKTFLSFSEKKYNLSQQDISNLVDDVVSKICNQCYLKNFCWNDNFYSTYQNIFSLLNNCENNGFVDINSIPNDFRCVNLPNFVEILNKTFELYRLNLIWNNKIIESRELIGQQLNGISKIITELSDELGGNISFKENLSNKIKFELKSNSIKTKNVIVTENKDKRLEILLNVEPCYVPNGCGKTIIPIVENIVGKKLVRNCYDCIIKKEDSENICAITLIEEQKLRVSTSVAIATKSSSKQSGDSHTFMSLPNGNYLLALSDGMGSGNQAKAESSASIELFEDFITAGFNKNTAINMINSILFLKSSKEIFSTLDICTIDLYSGISEFIKIGAVSTFIIRKNKIKVLKSSSLPVGILNNVEPEINKIRLEPNDIIIMMTDGVIDSKNLLINKENWILDLLENINTKNTKEIANLILEKAKENSKNTIKDDMTVLVARLWDGYN